MTTFQLVVTVAGAVTISRRLMQIIEYLDRPQGQGRGHGNA